VRLCDSSRYQRMPVCLVHPRYSEAAVLTTMVRDMGDEDITIATLDYDPVDRHPERMVSREDV